MARIGPIRRVSGGLAPWQGALAARLLLRDLSGDPRVAELARCCGLSRSYFIKAFKVSMGLPPHRWLMRRRIQRAQELLERSDDSLSAIAASCGFADQSHFTRIFHAAVGTSPAAWRRERKAGGGNEWAGGPRPSNSPPCVEGGAFKFGR